MASTTNKTVLSTSAQALDKEQVTRIKGVLVPAEWAHDGRITQVTLLTNTEEEYLIRKDPGWERIIPLMRETVEIVGLVHIDERGNRNIAIQHLRLSRENGDFPHPNGSPSGTQSGLVPSDTTAL
jgi:hypothetical protein